MNKIIVLLFACLSFQVATVRSVSNGITPSLKLFPGREQRTPIKEQGNKPGKDKSWNRTGGKKCTEAMFQDYDCKLKNGVDNQIKVELEAFYAYLRMGNFFAHENYYLPGLSKFLLDNSQEELKHGQKLIDYQTKRGSHARFYDIGIGRTLELSKSWLNATHALKEVLNLEYIVTRKIEALHEMAHLKGDSHLQDFLESNYIPEQYDSMKLISDKLKTLQRLTAGDCNKALAEFQFDKLVMQEQK